MFGGTAGDGDFQDTDEFELREHNFVNEIMGMSIRQCGRGSKTSIPTSNEVAYSMASTCRMWSVLAAVVFMTCHGCTANRPVARQDDTRERALVAALGEMDFVSDFRLTAWLLRVNGEWGLATAWIADLSGEQLRVARVEFDEDSHVPLIMAQAEYNGLSGARRDAILAAFSSTPAWRPGRDYWAGPSRAFAGVGHHYGRTAAPTAAADVDQFLGQLTGSGMPNRSEAPVPFPIELGIPWLITEYYSAEP